MIIEPDFYLAHELKTYPNTFIKLDRVSFGENNMLIPIYFLQGSTFISNGNKKGIIMYPYFPVRKINTYPRTVRTYASKITHDMAFGNNNLYRVGDEDYMTERFTLMLFYPGSMDIRLIAALAFPYNYIVKQLNLRRNFQSSEGIMLYDNRLLEKKPLFNGVKKLMEGYTENVLFTNSIEKLCFHTGFNKRFNNITERESFIYELKKATFKRKPEPHPITVNLSQAQPAYVNVVSATTTWLSPDALNNTTMTQGTTSSLITVG